MEPDENTSEDEFEKSKLKGLAIPVTLILPFLISAVLIAIYFELSLSASSPFILLTPAASLVPGFILLRRAWRTLVAVVYAIIGLPVMFYFLLAYGYAYGCTVQGSCL